jgi:alpha-mannosidase
MTKIDTIYLVHHSHTDIGYTHDQPIVWELQTRFIDEALDLAERYAGEDSDGAFRWTVETTGVLKRWLATASTKDIERFRAMEQAGRIEVTGMFANLTPLLDTGQFLETFQVLRTLRQDYGFRIEHAMNCDVNGENWPLVDLLLDLGINGFTMAINTHFGGAVQPRPSTFLWQGPTGRTIPVNNGWPYDKGWREGIGRDADELEQVRWPRLQQYLDSIGYPIPILLIQSYHPYGDNGSAYDFTPFINAWNDAGKSPRIVMATPRIWWQAVSEHTESLPTHRGDWTDYWNFGSISSAREQTMNRASRTRLRAADSLYAAVRSLPGSPRWSPLAFERYRESAWDALTLWDEHTWGADIALGNPQSEDTATQWHHKANYAYTARSLSLMLQRDALADLARHVTRASETDLLVFNPLPWARTITGPVPHFVVNPRGLPEDTTAGRHHQDRESITTPSTWRPDHARYALPPTEVPAYGYAVVRRDSLVEVSATTSEDASVENHRYRATFDRERGGIVSLYDKKLNWELVDSDFAYPFNGYVHERVADESAPWPRARLFRQEWYADLAEIPPGWQTDWWAQRSGPSAVIGHEVQRSADGITVIQTLNAPGCHGHLTQRVFLPDYADFIECEAAWTMGLDDHPEAAYLAFPFNLPGATPRYDVGLQPVIPGDEQLPGVCRDYFTVQGWVDFSDGERGITIATPDNPLVQLGDFHFGHFQREFELERALLLGWVTNNYWETNFRAHQPGPVSARYRFLPYTGAFDESRAHRFGLEAMHNRPLFQHMGEPAAETTDLPEQGTLLQLPGTPVLVLHILQSPDENGATLTVRLLNASDTPQTARIASGLLTLTAAQRCDLLGNATDSLDVADGGIALDIPPRRIAVVRLAT